MDQPINLSSLLNIPGAGRGRGRGTSRGRGRSQSPAPSHGRRGPAQQDAPPGFSPEEIEASHRDKRQRLDASSVEQPSSQLAAPQTPLWAPQFMHGGRPVTVHDSVESEGTALALSQAFMLPGDMQKVIASSPDNLLGSFMSHSAKTMQKMVAMVQKLGQSEPQRARLASENAKLQNTIVRLERERNQARGLADELRNKLEGAEDSLNQTLTELEASKNEAKTSYQLGYNEGIRVATESYTEQMPGIQDQVFEAGWLACLTKSGAPESSLLWTEIDLPSTRVVADEQDEVGEENNVESEPIAQIAEQTGNDAAVEDGTNPGQKEASGGAPESTPVVENVTAPDSPPVIQDLTNEE
ncbi:hypothetical protein RHMOL_Rhmol10G0108600 [Rhododendron molle]|uniref:Uncharacterized protein n=1 Tax=Rhododendron molle TaxID=49168 RepID=A0ACC0M103_RHOML|nr:hypothetical protein RHMOL_Rhmol10G0108600 [Rhododendron molle]